jgi:5-formyltetrahydrofolate cyclo-ligase
MMMKAGSKGMAGLEDQTIVQQKVELRQKMRDARKAMAQGQYQKISAAIERKILDSPEFKAARRICCYVHKAETREPATDVILRSIVGDASKELVVPITRVKESRLDLSLVRDLSDLKPATFNVPEPVHESIIDPATLDLVIVPCLAVDTRGMRLGYGKAYYDKLLAILPPRVQTMALAFEFQVFPEIPAAHHDKPVKVVVTEKRFIRCGP